MKTATKLLLLAILVMMPLGLQAQQMNEKLAKKASVVVLIDYNVDVTGTAGNVIYLRLNDKSRKDNWRNGVHEIEYCMETKVRTETLLPISKDMLKIIPPVSSLFTLPASNNIPKFGIDKTEDGQALVFSITDEYGSRKYKIVAVAFYKSLSEVETGQKLGVEYDATQAWKYIAQMFKVYE